MKYFLLLLSLLLLLTSCTIKDCKSDLDCFKEYATKCDRSRINLKSEGNNIRVTIRGLSTDACKVSFKIEEINNKISMDYPTESKIAIGKTLNCRINRRFADYETLDYSNEIVNLPNEFDSACTGPIKDLMKGPLKELITKEINKTLST